MPIIFRLFFSPPIEAVRLSGERLRQTLHGPIESQEALKESHGEFRCIVRRSIDTVGQSVNGH